MRAVLFLLLAVTLLLAACAAESVVCNAPYIKVGTECCLDSDANQVCDRDEGTPAQAAAECPALDCSKCAATIVERNVTVTEKSFVCGDGTIAESAAACTKQEQNPFDGYDLVKTSDPSVLTFTARPACRENYKAVELHYKVGTASPNITVQAKTSPNGQWKDIYSYDQGSMDKYFYGTYCPQPYCAVSDFYLGMETSYVLRLKLDYRSLRKIYEFSDEVLVDGSDGGPYMTKLC